MALDLAHGAHWQLGNLTEDDIRNIDAAIEVAFDDGDHGMTGVDETRAKVKGLVDALRSAGVWPERVRCDGTRDVADRPTCDGPNPLAYRFTAPGGTVGRAVWCDECAGAARHELGYEVELVIPEGKRHPITSVESQVYIDTGELPDAEPAKPAETYTWTDHLGGPCRSCGRKFRVTQEAIDLARENYGEGTSDEAIAGDLDFCLDCVEGISHPEEHDTPETSRRALIAIPPAEAAPLIACMVAAEWQTQQNIVGLGDDKVPDFAEVHKWCDGNMLGYETVERLLGPNVPSDLVREYVSAAHPLVDDYLRLRYADAIGG